MQVYTMTNAIILHNTKKGRKMAEAKILSLIFNLLGGSLIGVGLLSHLDWFKGIVSFILGTYIVWVNFQFRKKRLREEQRQREIKTQEMELDLVEKIRDVNPDKKVINKK